ncbi:Pantothenate kinase type III, CoaX-like [hydrothermal vent metagenome]|uniref:Type III pantothenate kinase n=1 Tax=hydrothermal vent metagenome TaxID=652676 RepID=A0A1W1CGV7_9ZZZZ
MLLADIGNTHFHIYNGKEVEHLSYAEAIKRYKAMPLSYISVKKSLLKDLDSIRLWQNISQSLFIEGEYSTMGVDRKALCLSYETGIFIDAGSAITVDIVEDSVYKGGFILLGLKASLEAYANISPALDTSLNKTLGFKALPRTTKDGISYGIIASIKALIEKHSQNKILYFTGGDGLFLSQFFDDAMYDETLVFQGLQKAIKEL